MFSEALSVSSLVLTSSSRSSDIDWSVCVFCQCKTCKRDKKLHNNTSDERTKRFLNIATLTDDGEMTHKLLMMGLQRMQYIMLLLWQITYLTSEHDNVFQFFISTIKDDLLTHKKIFTLTQLLELFFWISALWSKGKLPITQITTEIRKTFWWFDNNTTTTRLGYSNLIYSSAISTPEAIGAATRIKADMHSATVDDLSNVAHICDESKILHAAAEGKSATLPFRMTNTLHLKRSQYQIMMLRFLPLWKRSCVGCWMILPSSQQTIALLFQ